MLGPSPQSTCSSSSTSVKGPVAATPRQPASVIMVTPAPGASSSRPATTQMADNNEETGPPPPSSFWAATSACSRARRSAMFGPDHGEHASQPHEHNPVTTHRPWPGMAQRIPAEHPHLDLTWPRVSTGGGDAGQRVAPETGDDAHHGVD